SSSPDFRRADLSSLSAPFAPAFSDFWLAALHRLLRSAIASITPPRPESSLPRWRQGQSSKHPSDRKRSDRVCVPIRSPERDLWGRVHNRAALFRCLLERETPKEEHHEWFLADSDVRQGLVAVAAARHIRCAVRSLGIRMAGSGPGLAGLA